MEKVDCWKYPEGYEYVKSLIDFLPEEEKDGYLNFLIETFAQV